MILKEIKEILDKKFVNRHERRVFFPSFFSDFNTEADAENARICVVEVLEQLTRRPLSEKGCDWAKGEIIPDFCCKGFGWEISVIFPDENPDHSMITGSCTNPDCPDWNGEKYDLFRGVSSVSQEDLKERLGDEMPEVACGSTT